MKFICEHCGDKRSSIPKRSTAGRVACENIRACNTRRIKTKVACAKPQ